LFLDEIGDVPLAMQVKLLRLIESGTFRRVGAVDTQQSEFRLVAATHKPLEEMVARGDFRQDLYYRISAFPIHLPPLRERPDDIPLLVESLLQRGAGGEGKSLKISTEAMAQLLQHDWPGNIRELRNVIERARLFADDGMIKKEHLALDRFNPPRTPGIDKRARQVHDLVQIAREFNGSRKELAASLGMSERTLYRRMKEAESD
jgi:transcriptional regulator with PAS, ATPase and Fis domain